MVQDHRRNNHRSSPDALTDIKETIKHWTCALGVDRGPDTNRVPETKPGVITEADVFEKLRELVEHGYGRLEVVVRDHELSRVDWLKSQVRQTR